jgi:hypothetical protein
MKNNTTELMYWQSHSIDYYGWSRKDLEGELRGAHITCSVDDQGTKMARKAIAKVDREAFIFSEK